MAPDDNTKLSGDAVDQMSVREILDVAAASISTAGGSLDGHAASDYARRLIDLAYFEAETSDDDRAIAVATAESLIKSLEIGLAQHPDSLAALRHWYQHTLRGAKLMGFGSLAWEIQHRGLEGAEVAKFIIQPSSGALLADLIEVEQEAGEWSSAKPGLLKCLLDDRRRDGESDAVLVLGRLIAAKDLVAWHMLAKAERDLFLLADRNYFTARQVLQQYGLLPPLNRKATKLKKPEPKVLDVLIVSATSLDKSPGPWVETPDLGALFDRLPENQQIGVKLLVVAFRLTLLLDIIYSLYGERIADRTEERVFSTVLKQAGQLDFKRWITTIREAEKHVRLNDPKLSLDYAMSAAFMDHYVSEGTSKDDSVTLATFVTRLLSAERSTFSDHFRYQLKFHFSKTGLPKAPPRSEREVHESLRERWPV